MSDPGRESSFWGRCPTCSQVVTLSEEERLGHMECPSCQATAVGTAFLQASTPPRVFGTARRAVSDDERTHLILDAVPVDDDESTAGDQQAPLRPAPPEKSRAPAYDPERTHLILDPIETADDDDDDAAAAAGAGAGAAGADHPASAPTLPAPASAASAASPAASSTASVAHTEGAPQAADAQPTRLFIDPVHLKSLQGDDAADDQKTHLFIPSPREKSPERARGGATAADEAPAASSARQSAPPASPVPPSPRSAPSPPPGKRSSAPPSPPERGRAEPARDERTKLMLGPVVLKDAPITAQAAAAVKAPSVGRRIRQLGLWIDDLMHERWPLALVAAAIVCGLLSPFTDETGGGAGSTPSVLPSMAMFLGLVAFVLAWASQLPGDDEGGWTAAAVARVQGATRLWLDDVQALGSAPQNLRVFAVGQLLALAGFAGLVVSSSVALVAALLGSSERATGVAFWSGLALLVGVSAAQFARRAAVVAPAPDELGESVSAARGLAALVDLSEPLPPSFIDGHTPLHRILIALSQWRAGSWPDDAGYVAALERHFQRHLPASQVERDKWLGPTRDDGIASLVIDDIVLIEVARRFAPAGAARALARVGDLAPRWPAKPIILAIFDAPREAVFQSAATSSLVYLHDDYPLVTVRMPEQRG
jgi:hypothetical protein